MRIVESGWLPVEPKTCTVLGYKGTSKHGKELWASLNWNWYYFDGWNSIPHMFDAGGGIYMHVRVKWDKQLDGVDKETGKRNYRYFRVRCLYEPGSRYGGREVRGVGIGFIDGRPMWIVRTREPERRKAKQCES